MGEVEGRPAGPGADGEGGPLDRRALLRLGAAVTAAGIGATLLPAGGRAYAEPGAGPYAGGGADPGTGAGPYAADAPDALAWRELRTMLGPGGWLHRPGDAGYGALAPPQNRRYAGVLPAGIASCASTADVRAAVRWARKHGVPLVPRSGGHNYAGYSTTQGLLLDLSRMNAVTARRIRGRGHLLVGGGATNSDVYRARAANLYVPGGRCPGVGVAGLTLGGGLGFNDRKWGLTCDNLVETRLVLADGSLVRADERENPDLLWACRGGAGGNWGVNTAFVFAAADVSHQVATVFELRFDVSRGPALLRAVREIVERDRHDDFDCRIAFVGRAEASLEILGRFLGPQERLERLLAPLLALRPATRFMEQGHFWQAQERLSARPSVTALASKSLVPHTWPDEGAALAMAEWARRWRPGTHSNICYVTLFAMGGATSRLTPSDTAFPHRAATFVLDVGTAWPQGAPDEAAARSLHAIGEMYRDLRRRLRTSAAYVNFPDPDLPLWWEAYYGGNYRRLVAVKRRYDPAGFFRYGQSVGSAP
ncbi:FAD-binding oxidoreductase [Thermocatellispora tengchongensis]|uniref:FAD-binding oxidoreductase n=1 Tax=Thermocatellispora tengchongensis TaxID=1073253 RepID=UPI003635437E